MNPYSGINKVRKVQISPAREALQAAFLQLYREKNIMEISVKALCERAGVARTTFYANYMNICELQEEIEDRLIFDLLKVNDHMDNHKDNHKDNMRENNKRYMQSMLDFTVSNYNALKILLVERPDGSLIQKWKTAVKYHFWEQVSSENGREGDFALELIASMAVGGYTYLLQNPGEFDGDKLYEMVFQGLSMLP